MAVDLLGRLSSLLNRKPWYQLPRLLAMGRLIDMRNDLREKNLHDTEEPPLQCHATPVTVTPEQRETRMLDGTFNDLKCPSMGAVGRRFGRNVPLENTFPDTANLLVPNPRVISRELMTREQFQPASILNLMAAAWIQFMVHDWFVHARSKNHFVDVPIGAGDDWGQSTMRVPRTEPDPAPAGSKRPPAYANQNSHWWDSSHIYGCEPKLADSLRSHIGGKLRLEATGLLPVDPVTGLHFSGFTDNWWIGLAMLHNLFTLEHNHICDQLAHLNPTWDDQRIYVKAKLINAALMAKIHSVEWTPAILPHPMVQLSMKVNWSGLAGEDVQEFLEFIDEKELLGGIVGSQADHHAAPYSLTEEFVSVYRMHPLMPDDYEFRSLSTGSLLEKRTLAEIAGNRTPAIAERITMQDLFYSFGVSHPGAIRCTTTRATCRT